MMCFSKDFGSLLDHHDHQIMGVFWKVEKCQKWIFWIYSVFTGPFEVKIHLCVSLRYILRIE